MAFLFRWLMRAVLAMIALAAGGAMLAYYLAGQSLPDYDATFVLDGPAQEIEIVRDRYAVPHILSETDDDAFFGLGFVHAQDRLWQMTLMRRTVQGRLSEIFGAETVGIDELMRALDLYGYARLAVAEQTDDTRAALEAYADGVNAWLRVGAARCARTRCAGVLPLLAGHRALDTADSIAVQKLMALSMTDKAGMETLRARLSLALPPERLGDILPDSPNEPVMGLPQFSELFPGATGLPAATPSWRPGGASIRCRGRGSPGPPTPLRPSAGGRPEARRSLPPIRTWG